MAKFTDRSIKALGLDPGRKDRLVFDDDTPGLGLRITPKSKTFIVQWTDPATKRKVREPLGVWGSITIEQARAAVRSRLGDVARGIDPVAERKERKAAADAAKVEQTFTLDKLIKQWAALHLKSRSVRYRREAPRSLRYAFRQFLGRPVVRLTKAEVMRVVDGIAQRGRVQTARATVMYGRSCFKWAEKRGTVAVNPFAEIPITIPFAERDRVLSDAEVGEIWSAAGALPYPFGPLYRFALLTLQRREEVGGMRWSELSSDYSLWTISASRMKNNRPHDVHLSPAAREILRSLPRLADGDFVFTTTGKKTVVDFSGAKERIGAAMMAARTDLAERAGREPEPMVPWRLHDFRRTGVSRLAALGFDSIVADKLLGHKPAKLKASRACTSATTSRPSGVGPWRCGRTTSRARGRAGTSCSSARRDEQSV